MELFIVILIVGAISLYFVPSIIAGKRNAANGGAIIAINLLFGWTVIGWIAALIWACTDSPENESAVRRACPFCAEMIMAQAIVCPHCKRDVPKGEAAPMATIDNAAAAVLTEQAGSPGDAKFALMLVALAVVFVIATFWATGKPIIGRPAAASRPVYATGSGESPCSEFGNDLAMCERELRKRGIAFPSH